MPDPDNDAIIGDGVITIELEEEETEMADQVDLPPSVASQLLTESVGNIQANNRDGRGVGTVALGVLQAAAARNFDELGAVEGRSVSGLNATAMAPPSA